MNPHNYYVYIMASQYNGTLYIGVTNDLAHRVAEHKQGIVQGFTKKYEVDRLVYFEFHSDVNAAITREKQLKKWNRQWKINLIEKKNPDWIDLSTTDYQFPYTDVMPANAGIQKSNENETVNTSASFGFPHLRE